MSALVTPLELDFSTDRAAEFERESNEAMNWTEEALCLVWLSKPDQPDWSWWKGLANYERESWLNNYRMGRMDVEQGKRMPAPVFFISRTLESWKQSQRLAESWAKDIKKAFMSGTPLEFTPAPGYEHILKMALDIAQIPAGCLKVEELEEKR